MPFLHDPNAALSPERTAVRNRWLGRSSVAGTVVAASLAVIACGESEPPTILNTEKVERAIEQSSLDQRNKRVDVTCPSGVHQKKGLEFSCIAVARGSRTRFVVTVLNDSGRVRYEAP